MSSQIPVHQTNNNYYAPVQNNTASGAYSSVHAIWNLNQSQKNELQTLGDTLIQVAAQSTQSVEKMVLKDLGKQLQVQAQLPTPDKSEVTSIWEKLKILAESVDAVQSIRDALIAGIAVLGPIIGAA